MFEFDKHTGQPLAAPTRAYQLLPPAPERALLLWGEHCIECAAPDCFATCDLYDARPDMRCRRFEGGIIPNPRFTSHHGPAAEVAFRRWGKIEARGNAAMGSTVAVGARERLLNLLIRAADRAGNVVAALGGSLRWRYAGFGLSERINQRLLKRRDPARSPDAFVAEIYNPGEIAVAATLAMGVDRTGLARALTADQLPRPFVRRMSLEPGYNRAVFALAEFAEITESGLPFNISFTPTVDNARLVFLTLDFVRGLELPETVKAVSGPPPRARPAAKCVVFDLDNTLWDGVMVEGPVTVRPGVRVLFEALDARGILISVASKNTAEDAMSELVKAGLEEYLLYPQINWGPKSASIAKIAEKIDIGLDTFIFVDDNAFERGQVGSVLPTVETLPDTALSDLLEHPRLVGSLTAEAGKRRLMYRQNMERGNDAVHFGDDYLTFLKSCDIVVEIRPIKTRDHDRVTELVQRTNQLNFSGRKYARDEITRYIEDPAYEKYVVSCSDRYGDYGLVGFCLVQRGEWLVRVLDFMLSCRVQGKFIEQALFYHLTHRSDWVARSIEIEFTRTARNKLAEAVLVRLGFSVSDGNGPVARPIVDEDFAVDFLETRGAWPDTNQLSLVSKD